MLMALVGPDIYEKCLLKEYASEINFTGKAMKGMIYVSPEGLESDSHLASWLKICIDFVESLQPKKPK